MSRHSPQSNTHSLPSIPLLLPLILLHLLTLRRLARLLPHRNLFMSFLRLMPILHFGAGRYCLEVFGIKL